MFYLTKDQLYIILKRHQKKNYNHCLTAVNKSKFKNNIYYLNKNDFSKCKNPLNLLIMQF